MQFLDYFRRLGTKQRRAKIVQVEVLKRPQGTLFGCNATGGLVHYVTVKPRLDRAEGFTDVKGGVFDPIGTPAMLHGEAGLNLPLSSILAARAAGRWKKSNALLRNEYSRGAVGGSPGAGANLERPRYAAGRLTAQYEPINTAHITTSANQARSRISTAPYQSKATIGVFDAAGELIDVRGAAANETRATIGANGQDRGSDLDNEDTLATASVDPSPAATFRLHRPGRREVPNVQRLRLRRP